MRKKKDENRRKKQGNGKERKRKGKKERGGGVKKFHMNSAWGHRPEFFEEWDFLKKKRKKGK